MGCGFFSEERFNEKIASLVPYLVPLTRRIWQLTKGKMLATPAKFHYVFNLRDLSRIWQGMLTVRGDECEDEKTLLLLWHHECTRAIADRYCKHLQHPYHFILLFYLGLLIMRIKIGLIIL